MGVDEILGILLAPLDTCDPTMEQLLFMIPTFLIAFLGSDGGNDPTVAAGNFEGSLGVRDCLWKLECVP